MSLTQAGRFTRSESHHETSERSEGWITLGGYANIMSLRPCLCADAACGLFDHGTLSFCGSGYEHFSTFLQEFDPH